MNSSRYWPMELIDLLFLSKKLKYLKSKQNLRVRETPRQIQYPLWILLSTMDFSQHGINHMPFRYTCSNFLHQKCAWLGREIQHINNNNNKKKNWIWILWLFSNPNDALSVKWIVINHLIFVQVDNEHVLRHPSWSTRKDLKK